MLCVECKDLTFSRGAREILHGVSFELPEHCLMGLFGHNGAGKSTLIKLILGILKPAGGSLSVLGGAPGAQPLRVGYLPENASFYDAMTVGEHLAYFARLKGVAPARAKTLAETLGLAPVFGQRLGQCSKGQRQRLGLAQALLSSPKLLLLDEPTVGLDPTVASLMYAELEKLAAQGCAVIVCTHELALIERHLARGLFLADGRVVACGTPQELAAAAHLPVAVRFAAPAAYFLANTRFAAGLKNDSLVEVSEDDVPALLRLASGAGRLDFEIRRTDLYAVFEHFVSREAA